MSQVRCRGQARRCRAELLLDGTLERRGSRGVNPTLQVRLRSPRGRTIARSFRLGKLTSARRRVRLSMPVPRPELWSPERPRLYSARITLRERGAVQQLIRRSIGMRSVT